MSLACKACRAGLCLVQRLACAPGTQGQLALPAGLPALRAATGSAGWQPGAHALASPSRPTDPGALCLLLPPPSRRAGAAMTSACSARPAQGKFSTLAFGASRLARERFHRGELSAPP